MKVLTDVYGFDGTERKQRYYVKQLIKGEFKHDILFLKKNPLRKNLSLQSELKRMRMESFFMKVTEIAF